MVNRCADEILSKDRRSAEGWFLKGLCAKARRIQKLAIEAFSKAIRFDAGRYDAALEMAELYLPLLHHGEAAALLQRFEPLYGNSPYYLAKAADTYTKLGLHDRAWPLYRRADELQPGIDRIQAGLAACSVKAGKIELARSLYRELLKRNPGHQRNHYELSRLGRAKDFQHVGRMKEILAGNKLPPEKNIFLYYAIGKELEDLGQWEESFDFYKRGGDAASLQARAAGYTVDSDIELIDRIIETCSEDWLGSSKTADRGESLGPCPIFIVGLPRTGTTLTERVITCHSQVESADETFFLRIAIKSASGVSEAAPMSPGIISRAAMADSGLVARSYLDSIAYRLGDRPFFIDKYPENYLYLGFIAKAFPDARIVRLRRSPMDSCFAMYKQSYFRQAYTLDDLGDYYIAYDRLSQHWSETLGKRIVDVEYERLVTDFEDQVRGLLDKLGLGFEPACLDFHRNQSPSATASAAQIRHKAHTRSVDNWLHWEKQLEPLRVRLEEAGIPAGPRAGSA